jgi:hypothetical protein
MCAALEVNENVDFPSEVALDNMKVLGRVRFFAANTRRTYPGIVWVLSQG